MPSSQLSVITCFSSLFPFSALSCPHPWILHPSRERKKTGMTRVTTKTPTPNSRQSLAPREHAKNPNQNNISGTGAKPIDNFHLLVTKPVNFRGLSHGHVPVPRTCARPRLLPGPARPCCTSGTGCCSWHPHSPFPVRQ